MASSETEGGRSIVWITVAVMLAIALLGWGFLAGSYAGAHATSFIDSDLDPSDAPPVGLSGRDVRRRFVGTAIELLPNLTSVISWHFSNRVWIPLIIIGLEILAVVGGFALNRVQKELAKPPRRRY